MSEFEIDIQKLLNDKRVIEEIQRHLWIESEKAGYDVGFEKAKEDWFKKFAVAWMEYHMPEELAREKKKPIKPFPRRSLTKRSTSSRHSPRMPLPANAAAPNRISKITNPSLNTFRNLRKHFTNFYF